MNASGWIQLIVFIIGLGLITKPMGLYLIHVFDPEVEGGMGILEKCLGWFEHLCYRIGGIDPKVQQNWRQYCVALLVFGAVATMFSYGCYRLQDVLPLKQNIANLTNTVDKDPDTVVGVTLDANNKVTAGGKISPVIAFIQAISFATNTDWQSYEPEVTFTYFSQTVPTLIHFFFSSIVGIAVACALVRGVVRKQTNLLGNFWVDLTRGTLYLFLPICIVFALLDVWQGIPMNFRPYTTANVLDQSGAASTTQPSTQTILQGPMAAYCAPKVLGLNGPGFTGADCAHPFENPTGLSEFLQLMLFFSVISGLTYYYGRMIKNTLHGWNIWLVMLLMLLSTLLITWYSESTPNPRLADLGISQTNTNMEGKEVRIGIYNSAAWSNDVTDTAEGANNCAHDSLTPLAGFMLMFNMHMDEVIFGGIGSGLFGILVFIFCAVFLAGLMIGRTPEYLGKKIEAFDVKCSLLYLLVMAFGSLGFTAWAVVTNWGTSSTGNGGPHGFSEIFYAYSSGCANNGTAFGGYTCTPTVTKTLPNGTSATVYGFTDSNGNQVTGATAKMFNITQGYCMLFGRYFEIVPILALAGALARKKPSPVNIGSFPVVGPTFVLLIIGVIVIVGALTFLPGLAMGPLLEHFIMTGSKILY
ncbi:MAG: potassium-transporting ATPase subunit KdpA [Tepidisphaeraceae bacterium]|jgi:K+-transporting ATPase ATPase A chain